MTTHVGVLPSDLIQALSATLEDDEPVIVPQSLVTLRLPHPRTGMSSLFLPWSNASSPNTKSQILEVQAVQPPDPRSWFLGEKVISNGKLLIITPVDPVFFLLSMLQSLYLNDGSVGNYLPADDIFEEASRRYENFANGDSSDKEIGSKDIIRFGSLQCVKDALRCICDVKEITPEIVVYRPSQTKSLGYLRAKVARISTPGALDVSKSVIRALAKDGLMEDDKEALLQSGRTRAACDLLGHYLSAGNRALLFESYDFTELDKYLEKSRVEVVATLGAKLGKSKKKPAAEDNKKRKAGKGTQGVDKLKKANVNGMAKLSSFFKKA